MGVELPGVEQLERPDDPLSITGIDLVRGPRRSVAEHAVQRRRSPALELGQPPLPRPFGRRGPQAELGQCRPEVQSGPPDHDRATAGDQQRVDLGVGQFCILAGAEAGVHGQERDQPVLERLAFVRGGGSGQRLQPLVHLERVGRDRHRPLAELPQATGKLDRDVGLADPGRTEQSDHLGARHGPEYRGAIRIGTGISTEHDPLTAGTAAARSAAAELNGDRPDLAVVFASGAHLTAPEAMLEGVQAVLDADALVGCGAGGVLGCGRELESGTALAVWAATFDDGGAATPFHATLTEGETEHRLEGLPDLEGSSGLLMLSDPYSFPTDAVLEFLSEHAPTVPVLGGLSSGRTAGGDGALFVGDEVYEAGRSASACRASRCCPASRRGRLRSVARSRSPRRRETSSTSWRDGRRFRPSSRSSLSSLLASVGWSPAGS